MEIILLKDIDNLGYKHDIVSVKPGYGRNYLIPQKMGVIANEPNRKKLDKILADIEQKELAKLEDYKKIAADLEGKTLKIGVKAGSSGKIFGSVTNVQIAQALTEQLGVEIERRKIKFDEVKELGTYTAVLDLHKEVSTEVSFELVQE
jgi:large subunit ribosomal protein L9